MSDDLVVALERFVDELRNNSEQRSYPGFDTRTAETIAQDLEELLEGASVKNDRHPFDIVDMSLRRSEVGPVLEIDDIPGARQSLEIHLRTFIEGSSSDLDVEIDCDGDNGCWWILVRDDEIVGEISPEIVKNLESQEVESS